MPQNTKLKEFAHKCKGLMVTLHDVMQEISVQEYP